MFRTPSDSAFSSPFNGTGLLGLRSIGGRVLIFFNEAPPAPLAVMFDLRLFIGFPCHQPSISTLNGCFGRHFDSFLEFSMF